MAVNKSLPAFPNTAFADPNTGEISFPWDGQGLGGISDRDYFAAKAMQALIVKNSYNTKTEVAEAAYEYADTMISFRNQTK